MDLLAEHRGDEETTRVRPEIEFRRLRGRRARRGPPAEAAAFDCAQLKLEEEESLPAGRQSPTTLLMTLKEGLTSFPPGSELEREERQDKLRSLVLELGRRGFDVDAIIHDRWLPEISIAAVMPAVLEIAMTAIDVPELPNLDAGAWRGLLLAERDLDPAKAAVGANGSTKIDHSAIGNLLITEAGRVTEWMSKLSIDALIAWKVPTLEEYRALEGIRIEEPQTPHSWLVDRFTVTYLDDWSDASLRREWDYLHARMTPPCNPSQMAARRVNSEDVARELAERTTGHSQNANRHAADLDRYVRVAVDLLRKGERAAAGALFDAVCTATPLSGDAVNNRGFCALPDDAARALSDFERASELGVTYPLVTAGNRVLALHRLRRRTPALKVAEEIWATETPDRGGFMWSYSTKEPELLEIKNLREYIAGLAAFIAEEEGDDSAAVKWTTRRNEIEAKRVDGTAA